MANKNAANVLAGVILGAAAGLAAGILIAPDKGKETRAKLKKQARNLAENVKGQCSKYKDELKHGYEKYKKEFKKKASDSDVVDADFDELKN